MCHHCILPDYAHRHNQILIFSQQNLLLLDRSLPSVAQVYITLQLVASLQGGEVAAAAVRPLRPWQEEDRPLISIIRQTLHALAAGDPNFVTFDRSLATGGVFSALALSLHFANIDYERHVCSLAQCQRLSPASNICISYQTECLSSQTWRTCVLKLLNSVFHRSAIVDLETRAIRGGLASRRSFWWGSSGRPNSCPAVHPSFAAHHAHPQTFERATTVTIPAAVKAYERMSTGSMLDHIKKCIAQLTAH